jgi:signal transduction histidine kinase
LLAVIKEALSNISKHSDATEVKLILREHPALYQLIIRDNGSKPVQGLVLSPEGEYIPGSQGMGLKSIFERVERLNGNVRITIDNGFEVFVSIPKGS